jgi:sugar phosphate isomerase/epimerase
LPTIVTKAREYGFRGFELAGKAGLAYLHAAPEIASEPERVAANLKDAQVGLVCLATSAVLTSKDPAEWATAEADIKEHVNIAARLGCPLVRVLPGGISGGRPQFLRIERREAVLDRIAAHLQALAPYAAHRGVTLVVENAGEFADSTSLWHIIEAADSPMVRCCWNPVAARIAHERPTTAIPRLASKIALVRACDGVFDENDRLTRAAIPGQGTVEIRRAVQLLRGIDYRGYLVFDWPARSGLQPADPQVALPAAASYLKSLLDEQPMPLTAYKGDKFRPRQGRELAPQP